MNTSLLVAAVLSALAAPIACGGSSPPPTDATSKPAEPQTSATPGAETNAAPAASTLEAPAASTEAAAPAAAPAANGPTGTLLGEPFAARSAVAVKGPGSNELVVTVYDGEVTCANQAAKNMGTARLSFTIKWSKGASSKGLSAYAKDAGIGKIVNYDKKGSAEATLIEVASDKARAHLVAKDAAQKTALEGDIDVVRCGGA